MKYASIVKRFGPYPAAHRQHTHTGHCAMVHGHNWVFEIELSVPKKEDLDGNGFVFDFGNFKPLKQTFEAHFDHTLMLSIDDPELERFRELEKAALCRLTVLSGGTSAEVLCRFVAGLTSAFLQGVDEPTKALVTRVRVLEDEKNFAEITL